jgi:hypothetical protein
LKDRGRSLKNASRIGKRNEVQLPRWLTVRKPQRMGAGMHIVRHELAG